MVHQAASDNLKPMRRPILILLLLSSYNLAKAQMQSPDTTAMYFLIHASIGNLQEIAAGKLAMAQGNSPEVRAFGKMMVADQGKAEGQLLALAKAQHIDLPSAATDTSVPELNLEKATGAKFDQLYVHNVVPGHRKTVMMFRDYGITGKNLAAKAFATATLPTLKEHLANIITIDKNL
jgi:putative membrane protein